MRLSTLAVVLISVSASAFADGSSQTLPLPLTAPLGGTGTSTAFTQGSVVFAGSGGVYTQDNANLNWNDNNKTFTMNGNFQQDEEILSSLSPIPNRIVNVQDYGNYPVCSAIAYTNDGSITAASNQFTSSNITSQMVGDDIIIANAGGALYINNYNTTNAVVSGGTGYSNGDTGVILGGTYSVQAAYTITNAVGGVVQPGGYTISAFGSYTVAPTNTVSTSATTGSGSGLTLTLGWWGTPLVTTISSVAGNVATLAASATSTVASGSATNSYWLAGPDDTRAVSAAIAGASLSASSPENAIVSFQAVGENCLISSTLNIQANGVFLLGRGIQTNTAYSNTNYLSGITESGPGTNLVWMGANNGTIIDREPKASSSPLFGGGMDGIGLVGHSLAATAVRFASVNKGSYPHLMAENFIGKTFDFEDSSNVSSAIDTGNQSNLFGDIEIDSETPAVTSGTAFGLYLNGNVGNTSGNIFATVRVNLPATGIEVLDADSNYFGHIWGNTGSNPTVNLDAGGASPGAASNYIAYVEGSGGVYARGTETGTPASSLNYIADYSTNNKSPTAPTCGTSAGLSWVSPQATLTTVNCVGNYQIGSLGINAGSQLVIGNGGTSAINSTDAFSGVRNNDAVASITAYNNNAGTSARVGYYFGDATSSTEASILLNGAGNTSGNGANSLTISAGAGGLYLDNLSTGGTYTQAACLTSNGSLQGDTSGTICGLSAARFKNLIDDPIDPKGLLALRTVSWRYKAAYQDHGRIEHVGLIADDVAEMDPRCAIRDEEGKVSNYSDRCVEAYLVAAVKMQQKEIASLREKLYARRPAPIR